VRPIANTEATLWGYFSVHAYVVGFFPLKGLTLKEDINCIHVDDPNEFKSI